MSGFDDFHPKFAEYAERVFAQNHLDSEIRKGKRGGAFCYTVLPRYTPWVLVNFAGRVRDVATLAHELGHVTGGADAQTYQPMNVNFGLFPPLDARVRKADRKLGMTSRARTDLGGWMRTEARETASA